MTTVAADTGTAELEDGFGTPLTAGYPFVNHDGFVVQLGYRSNATVGHEFDGNWIPLTGQGSANTVFAQSTIGDDPNNGARDGESWTSGALSSGPPPQDKTFHWPDNPSRFDSTRAYTRPARFSARFLIRAGCGPSHRSHPFHLLFSTSTIRVSRCRAERPSPRACGLEPIRTLLLSPSPPPLLSSRQAHSCSQAGGDLAGVKDGSFYEAGSFRPIRITANLRCPHGSSFLHNRNILAQP